MAQKLGEAALQQLFLNARTRNGWSQREVTDLQLRELYDILKFGPTSGNSCPARFVWVKSKQGKIKLSGTATASNKRKILAAPVTVVIGYDLGFPQTLPKLYPARGEEMQATFENDPVDTEATAFRNGTLQGAYLIMAARAIGFDCGPMSGFDQGKVDEMFFAGTVNAALESSSTRCLKDPGIQHQQCRISQQAPA